MSLLSNVALPPGPSTAPSTVHPQRTPRQPRVAAALVVPEARGGGAGAGGDRPGTRGSKPLTNAAETLRQSSPQLLHLADLLGRLRLNEVAHLGDAGLRQLPQTGPERSADNGEGARQEGGASSFPPPPPPPPPPPSPARRRRAGLGRRVESCRLRSGLGRGWAGGGVLRGTGGGRHRRRRGGPAPRRRRPAHFPSFVTESGAAGGQQWWRRGRRRDEGGLGTRCGSRGSPSARGTGGEKFSAPSFGDTG